MPSTGVPDAAVDEVAHPKAVYGSKASGTPPEQRTIWERLRARPALVIIVLTVLLAFPLLVALVALRSPRWYPILDMAQTEQRVRDVGTGDSPLIGLPGRIGPFGDQGSHPGPLSFWALAPVYRLLGASAWALQAASVALHTLAMGTLLWIAHRRGGMRLVLGVAAMLAVLIHAYGSVTLTEAWNPHLPVLFWLVLVFAVWSVVSDDLAMLPVGVAAGSFCAQTHVPYLGMSVGLLAFAVGAGVFRAYRNTDPDARRRLVRWLLVAVGVGALVWLPPVIDQLTSSRGNLTVLWEHFTDPPEDPVGIGRGVEVLLVHLNPWRLTGLVVTEQPQTATTGSTIPGVLFLAAWFATVAAAWRLRHRALLRLDLVLGVTLVLAVASTSRIFGFVWYYLLLWAWGLNALILLAVGWTLAVAIAPYVRGARRRSALAASATALAGIIVVTTVALTIDAVDTGVRAAPLSKTLGEITTPTARALASGSTVGGGKDGLYLITWDDPVAIGAQGWGLMNELDRRGFDVGALPVQRGGATPDQEIDPEDATARVHLVIGPRIEIWRARPDVEQVAYVEPRSRAERAEYNRIRAEVINELRELGLVELVSDIDSNLIGAANDTRISNRTRDMVVRMLNLGQPTAVFVGPPDTPD